MDSCIAPYMQVQNQKNLELYNVFAAVSFAFISTANSTYGFQLKPSQKKISRFRDLFLIKHFYFVLFFSGEKGLENWTIERFRFHPIRDVRSADESPRATSHDRRTMVRR